MGLKSILIEYAAKNGLKIGICKAGRFDEIRKNIEESHSALKGFTERDIEKRIDPKLTMADARSIICIAKRFDVEYGFEVDGKLRGYISMGAIGEDYHAYMKRYACDITEIIEDKYRGRCMVFCDTGPLNDRAIAKRCGIGYIGKSGNIVNDEWGASLFLAYIITDMDIEADEETDGSCGGCRKCIDSCPSGAISENGMDIEKCISYLTQAKRILTKDEIKIIGKNLYGCDACQRVCIRGGYEKTEHDIEKCMPEIESILKMTNREFKEVYSHTAMGWRGASVIKRNALCTLCEYDDDKAIELAEEMLINENEIIRDTALKVIEIIKRERGVKWDTGIQED